MRATEMNDRLLQANHLNKEGAPSFERSLEEDVLSLLVCNTLSNTFYVGKKEIQKETLDVFKEITEKNPTFFADAIVYARNNGLMRFSPIVGLVVLSTAKDKSYFKKIFSKVILIPDDIREFVQLCRNKNIRQGLGGAALDETKKYLSKLSEYHAVKYGGESEGMSLRDVLRMSHPKPANKNQEEIYKWLVKGWESVGSEPSQTTPIIWALETIKRTSDEDIICNLITTYNLTWEVVVPSVKKMTPKIWTALLQKMPYMATLRNLNTMDRNGVFKDKSNVDLVIERLSKRENVLKSKQLPFRFYSAHREFKGNQQIQDAIVDALELSSENVEQIDVPVCIANDISGSMRSTVSDKSSIRYCDITAILSACMLKRCKDVTVLSFNDEVQVPKVSQRDSIMTTTQKLSRTEGSTDLGAPIRYLTDKKQKVDIFIGITDNEDWSGHGFLNDWKDYQRQVNKNAKAFLINIAPYRDYVAPPSEKSVHFISGWNDSVLKYIQLKLKLDQMSVEDFIKSSIKLSTKE